MASLPWGIRTGFFSVTSIQSFLTSSHRNRSNTHRRVPSSRRSILNRTRLVPAGRTRVAPLCWAGPPPPPPPPCRGRPGAARLGGQEGRPDVQVGQRLEVEGGFRAEELAAGDVPTLQ